MTGWLQEPKKELKHTEDAVHEGPALALVLTTETFEPNHQKVWGEEGEEPCCLL